MREIEQVGRAGAIVKPDNAKYLILPTKLTPVTQRTLRQLRQLMPEVRIHHRNDTRVIGELGILSQNFEHYDARPPVIVRRRTDHSALSLMFQYPIDVF